ncbi:MAG: hypothetical protein HY923_01730 [Elusimicrobia bacterium]|nr:hypothetical protein [Elusimicrobiota bacterium]
MSLKQIAVLTAFAACAAVNGDRAHAALNSALDCLKVSAQSDGLSACLNESAADTPEAASAVATTQRPAASSPLGVAALGDGAKKHTRMVPTPTGFTEVEDGTVKAGFYKGLDSGFKTVFAGFVGLSVLGIQACGGPYASNFGTNAFYALGILLSIPGAIVGAVAAPLGAVAGMIAEKTSPGSTKGWFTF